MRCIGRRVFCDKKIGWNRLGVVLSVAIIAIAAVVLYRILRTINGSEVVEAAGDHGLARHRARRSVRRRRLLHPDLL